MYDITTYLYPFYSLSFQNFHGIGNVEWNVNMLYALFISIWLLINIDYRKFWWLQCIFCE